MIKKDQNIVIPFDSVKVKTDENTQVLGRFS